MRDKRESFSAEDQAEIAKSQFNVSAEELFNQNVSSAISINDDDYIASQLVVLLDEEEIARRGTIKFKITKFLWDSADKSPAERKFLFKLDFFLISTIMFGYFIKTLNQNNINTAYINGMQEYFSMYGRELNYMQSMWTAGYIIGQIPSNLILQRVSARYYLGGLELIWAALTFLTLACTSLKGMYALRFFIGLTESGFFPGIEYLLGCWYNKDELTKRSSLFACSGIAAGMVTGYLQTAIINGLQHTSIASWKWLFIFDGVISAPVALYTMVANPNTPETSTSWYFNDNDLKIAKLRKTRDGTRKAIEPFSLKTIGSVFKTWHVWIFPIVFLAYNNTCAAINQPTFTGWLKSIGYSSIEYNTYPTIVNAVGIGATLVLAWTADFYKGLNYPFILAYFVFLIFGCISLAIWNIPRGLQWASYFFIGVPTAWGQPMIFAWLNRLLHHDDFKRNLVVAITNTLAYVTSAWVPILVWNAQDLPKYFIGFTYTAVLSGVGIAFTVAALWFDTRDQKRSVKNETANEDYDVESIDKEALDMETF